MDEGVVTLVGAHKDANGAITEDRESVHPHTWAWKVPRSSRLTLVPVAIEPDGSPIELGQAVREGGALRMLPPNVDSPDGIWVRAERDGSLTEVKDFAALASHGWAWKYPTARARARCTSSAAASATSRARTTSRSSRARCGSSNVCFSYVPAPILKHVAVYANPGRR